MKVAAVAQIETSRGVRAVQERIHHLRFERLLSPVAWLVMVALATGVSILATGFRFGLGNNVFHIPYVLRFEQLPQFTSDSFYQSLQKFTSGVWPILRLVANEGNVGHLFLIGFIISRATAFAAMTWAFMEMGLRRTYQCAAALFCAAASPFLMNSSVVGGHGLFIDQFTHSELTWGPLLASIVALQRRQLVISAALAATVFLINAFIGVWLALGLSAVVLLNRQFLNGWRSLIKPVFVYALLCMPVVVWILWSINDTAEDAQAFSYLEYVRIYYPDHFLAESVSFRQWILLSLFTICGSIAALAASGMTAIARVQLALCGVLLVGVALPYTMDHRFVFDLHLLRVAGVVQFLSVILVIGCATATVFSEGERLLPRVMALLALGTTLWVSDTMGGLVVAACLLALLLLMKSRLSSPVAGTGLPQQRIIALLLTAALLLLDFGFNGMSSAFLLRWACVFAAVALIFLSSKVGSLLTSWGLAALVVAFAAGTAAVIANWRTDRWAKEQAQSTDYNQLVSWVRDRGIAGPVLVPLAPEYRDLFEEFQLATRTSVWVDWKQGAAVMWEPGYYSGWRERYDDVLELRGAADFADYARAHGIPHIIVPAPDGPCPPGSEASFRNAGFSVCRI